MSIYFVHLTTNTNQEENEQIMNFGDDKEEEKLETCKKRPLQIFPLLKELHAGWKNMQVPPLITRNAKGTRSLVVDIGLLTGNEFFAAMENGFEVVGFEPDPKSFPKLSERCNTTPNCITLDIHDISLPLQRKEGYSYIINAAAGSESTTMELKLAKEGSSLVHAPGLSKSKSHQVKVVRVDDVIKEDVYLFKIDTQGFDQFVLEGATELFKNHVVRQVIVEVDPFLMSHNDLSVHSILHVLQEYGMMCFQSRTDNDRCMYLGESVDGFEEVFKAVPVRNKKWSKCWEEFLCLNVEKVYEGKIPRW